LKESTRNDARFIKKANARQAIIRRFISVMKEEKHVADIERISQTLVILCFVYEILKFCSVAVRRQLHFMSKLHDKMTDH
jgi:hypothetical protein